MEQAVYAMLILDRLPGRSTLSAELLSERLGVSSSYLKKVMRKLVQAGLVHSTPGIRGGFSLGRRPEAITVYEIYTAVEGQAALYREHGVFSHLFADDAVCTESDTCALEALMRQAENAWANVLKKETLAMLQERVEATYPAHKLASLTTWINETKNEGGNTSGTESKNSSGQQTAGHADKR